MFGINGTRKLNWHKKKNNYILKFLVNLRKKYENEENQYLSIFNVLLVPIV